MSAGRRSYRILSLLALGLASAASSAHAGTVYVKRDAGPGGDGHSWSSAYQRVQDALAVAHAGDQIWVARGIYRPGAYSSQGSVTFTIPAGVALYGGFEGGETSLAQRNWIANETILSGDLHLDDGPGFGNTGENCYHVVTLVSASASTLDGFSIEGGTAPGGAESFGGGIHADSSYNVQFAHLVIRNNRAHSWGGGVYALECDITFTDCELRGNIAGDGGGMFVDFGIASFANSIVQGNTATAGTGGVSTLDGTAMLDQTAIAWNHGTTVGGATLCCAFSGGGQVRNSILWGNTGNSGSTAGDQLGIFSWISVVASDVQGDAANLNLDPRWADPLGPDGIRGTGDEDFHLSCLSPLIDRGNNAAIPAGLLFDFDGHPRRLDDPATSDTGAGTAPIVDLGPYEFACGCTDVERFCTALPNSSGASAAIGWAGSTSVHANALVLLASGAPPLKSGLFFYGPVQTSLPWGDGIRCVGGSLQRLSLLQTDGAGNASLALDFTQPPLTAGPHALPPGARTNVQFLFRDPLGGPAGWNSTDALAIHLCP